MRNLEKEVKRLEKNREKKIAENTKKSSEKVIMKTLEAMQKEIDILNGQIINIRAFFHLFKHAHEKTKR